MSLVIIGKPEHLGALRKRLDDPTVAVFADTDSLQALQATFADLPDSKSRSLKCE